MTLVPQFNQYSVMHPHDSPVDHTTDPSAKRQRKTVEVTRRQCNELRALLLLKDGVDISTVDPMKIPQLLEKAYSPRLNVLLDALAAIPEGANTPSDASDISVPSDDDEDALVPSIPIVGPPPLVPSIALAKPVVHAKPDVQVSPDAPRTAYKSETEIAISRIFDLGKVANVQDPSISATAPYVGPSVVSMSGFGELGRWGNQVLQYLFLKCYAARHNIEEIQTPGWVGASLFGLKDRPVQRALPPVIEFRETMANSTFTTDLLDYVCASNPEMEVAELSPAVLGEDVKDAPRNVDIWGWYQWHTKHFAEFKPLIQDTFQAVPEIHEEMAQSFDKNIRHRGGKKRTVVGLHMRLGDYKNIAASSFGYCAPSEWYLSWLQRIWPTLENPVLFVASDDSASVLRDFAEFDPVTAESAGVEMPSTAADLKAGFFPDWFCLTQCDVLAISNSTFSFSACLMNRREKARFFRAHYHGVMEEMNPWNAEPIVHRDMNKIGLSGMVETLQIVYNTQGSVALAKNLFYELPYYGLRSAIMKAVLWRQAANKANVQVAVQA